MKPLFTFRSILSLALLLIAASALVSGIKAGVNEVTQAAFLPVAMYATIVSYILGMGTLPTRRARDLILATGFYVIVIEAARLPGPLADVVRSIPQIQLDLWRSVLERRSPDISLLISLWREILERLNLLLAQLLTGDQAALRELLWDFPILLIPAWAGWWVGRRDNVLIALAPSIILQGSILDYTNEVSLSLQVAVFCLILLLGVNQRWTLRSAGSERTVRETYTTIAVLSFALVIGAGMMPAFSVREAAKTITDKDRLSETLGLERDIISEFTVSSSGLPLEHLVGSDPSTLQTIVFTVDTGERLFLLDEESSDIGELPRHYWRWVMYDAYNGREWTSSAAESISYDANEAIFPLEGDGYQIVHQAVEKTSPGDDRLYWTGSLVRANQPFESTWRTQPAADPLLTSDMLGALTQEQTYSADSLIPVVSEEQLRVSSQTIPTEIRQRYLSLPSTIPERVLQLASELTSGIDNSYDKARAIEAYLRTYPYELNVPQPPEGREIADYFLFDLKTGYCDYYATSMIVLARAAGVPARLVIGYSTGEYDPTRGEYVVRELHAHSWVEVYFTDVGWVEFEPTANQALITLPGQLPPPEVSAGPERPNRETLTKKGFFIERNYTPLMMALGMIVSFIILSFLHTQGLLRSHDSIGSMYEFVYFHGRKIYRDAPLHETPSIFAQKLMRKLHAGYRWLRPAPMELEYLTGLYMRETYSAHPISEDERRQAVRIWRKLFWRLLYARAVGLT